MRYLDSLLAALAACNQIPAGTLSSPHLAAVRDDRLTHLAEAYAAVSQGKRLKAAPPQIIAEFLYRAGSVLRRHPANDAPRSGRGTGSAPSLLPRAPGGVWTARVGPHRGRRPTRTGGSLHLAGASSPARGASRFPEACGDAARGTKVAPRSFSPSSTRTSCASTRRTTTCTREALRELHGSEPSARRRSPARASAHRSNRHRPKSRPAGIRTRLVQLYAGHLKSSNGRCRTSKPCSRRTRSTRRRARYGQTAARGKGTRRSGRRRPRPRNGSHGYPRRCRQDPRDRARAHTWPEAA